jgi:hypothetical protein
MVVIYSGSQPTLIKAKCYPAPFSRRCFCITRHTDRHHYAHIGRKDAIWFSLKIIWRLGRKTVWLAVVIYQKGMYTHEMLRNHYGTQCYLPITTRLNPCNNNSFYMYITCVRCFFPWYRYLGSMTCRILIF